jgi:hypothetical protein
VRHVTVHGKLRMGIDCSNVELQKIVHASLLRMIYSLATRTPHERHVILKANAGALAVVGASRLAVGAYLVALGVLPANDRRLQIDISVIRRRQEEKVH